MKFAALTWSTAVALLLVLDVGSSQAKDCQDILDNNRYHCQASQDNGKQFE